MKVHGISAIAIVVAAGSLLAACGPSTVVNSANPAAPHAGFVLGFQTDAVISRDQARLSQKPDDWKTIDELAAAYLQRVREVGDPSYYGKVDALLQRALAHDPADPEATISMGLLALARHQFSAGLEWGMKGRTLSPGESRPLGIIGDAQVELGRYPEAVTTFQQMVHLRPDLSSYARVSYARELYGDVDGAIGAMEQAVEAGGPVPENSAYTRVLLANLYFNSNRLDEAESQDRRALFDDPKYPYALAGLAKIGAARGDYSSAVRLFREAVDTYPLPDFVMGLADVYAVSGQSRQAKETYDLAAAEQQLYQASGVDLDAELALFDADHQRDLPAALSAARRAMTDRPSVRSADILAWTLYQVGDDRSALAASTQAMRLGTQDAAMFFHRGMIEARLGMGRAALADLLHALSINPYFSLVWAPVARQTVAALSSPSPVYGGGQGGGL